MAWFGSTPIGALLMGWVIQATSPRVPFALGGLSAMVCAAGVIGRRGAARAGSTDTDRLSGTTPAQA
jgi:hypothetical protein